MIEFLGIGTTVMVIVGVVVLAGAFVLIYWLSGKSDDNPK
jgi:hypothetical protein